MAASIAKPPSKPVQPLKVVQVFADVSLFILTHGVICVKEILLILFSMVLLFSISK